MIEYIMQDGVKYTISGHYKIPEIGDYYLGVSRVVQLCAPNTLFNPKMILKREKWRADLGGAYFLLTKELQPCMGCDTRTQSSNTHYRVGNYFRTEEEAQLASIKIKALLAQ